MSEQTQTETALKHSFGFSRKINLGSYESAEATLFVQFSGDPINERETFEANARAAAYEAKGLVFQQLGVDFIADGEDVIREAITRTFPTATVTTTNAVMTPVSPSAIASGGSVQAQDIGEYQGKNVRLAFSKFGPFYAWGNEGEEAVMANLATWHTEADPADSKKKRIKPGEEANALSLASAIKQIDYKLSRAA